MNFNSLEEHKILGKPSPQKKSILKDIYLHGPPSSPHNEDIKKDILASCLTPSLLPKIRISENFLGGFNKANFTINSYGNII